MVELETMHSQRDPYKSDKGQDIARPIRRVAANGHEGAFEALTNQATGSAGGI